jgi:hypothetical protein
MLRRLEMSGDKRKTRVVVMQRYDSPTMDGGVNSPDVQEIFNKEVQEFEPCEHGTKSVKILPPPVVDTESGEPVVDWGTRLKTSILFADFEDEETASEFRWEIDDLLEAAGLKSQIIVDSGSVPGGMA